MKRLAIILAALLAANPAAAQSDGKITMIITSMPQKNLEHLDSTTLATQVQQMRNNGSLSGASAPLVLNGRNHEYTINLGSPATRYVGSNFSVVTVQGMERRVAISYGPAKAGGLGFHAEAVDIVTTPKNGVDEETVGRRYPITGVVPSNGMPQASLKVLPSDGPIDNPTTLIVLVEP